MIAAYNVAESEFESAHAARLGAFVATAACRAGTTLTLPHPLPIPGGMLPGSDMELAPGPEPLLLGVRNGQPLWRDSRESVAVPTAIVDGWKVVRYADDGKVELYDLNNDPMEKKDLAEMNPEKRKSLLTNLDDRLTAVGAQLAQPNPDYDPDPNKYSGGIRGYKAWKAIRQKK